MDLRDPTGKQTLGKRIQAAIAEAGYASLSAFAEEVGWSRALIYQYVHGAVLVQLDRLQTIGELTGRPVEWFLADEPGTTSADVASLRQELASAAARVAELEAALARERAARLQERDQHRARLLEALRETCRAQAKAGDARGLLETAQTLGALAEEANDERALLAAKLHAAHAGYELGETEHSREAAAEALRLAQALGNKAAEDAARQELFRSLQASGRPDEAREHVLQLAKEDRWWPRWSSLVSLAALAEQVGELDEAEARLDEAEAVIEEPSAPAEGQAVARAYLESNRANLLLARGRYGDALVASFSLQLLAERAGLPEQLREAALNRAICFLRTGDLEQAEEQLRRLREWAAYSGDRRLKVLTDVFESERLCREGDAEGAKRAARSAIEAANEGRDGHILAEAELALGLAYLAEWRRGDARYYLERALHRAERLQHRRLTVAAQLMLDEMALAEGAKDAVKRLQADARVARDLGYEDLHQEAVAALDEARAKRRRT